MRILIAAGGTGGHVFPALAVAQELKSRGAEVFWLGSPAGIEARVVPEAGFSFFAISVRGIRQFGWKRKLLFPWMLLVSLWQSWRVFRQVSPEAMLGMGGFVAGPAGVVAKLCGVPLVLHEQNSIAGLTNRLLAPLSRHVLMGYRDSFKSAKSVWVGNPVRADLLALPVPSVRYQSRSGPIRVLVVGGSLGAQVFNEWLPEVLSFLPESQRPEVLHQAGHRTLKLAEDAYAKFQVSAKIVPFIDDMAHAYAWADLVICRAGALTLAEVMDVGVAVVMVPYPFAVDDHQTHNALSIVDVDGGVLVNQAELSVKKFAALLSPLLLGANARHKLSVFAENVSTLAKPNATVDVAQFCLGCLS